MLSFGEVNMYEYVTSKLNLEWLFSTLPAEIYYNATVIFSVLSCRKLPAADTDDSNSLTYSSSDTDENGEQPKSVGGLLDTVFNLFESTENLEESSDIKVPVATEYCEHVFHFTDKQTVYLHSLISGTFIIIVVLTLWIIWLICHFSKTRHDCIENKEQGETEDTDVVSEAEDIKPASENVCDSDSQDDSESDVQRKKKSYTPLYLSIPAVSNQQVKNFQSTPSLDELFDGTVRRFLNELDRSLGIELSHPTDGFDANTSLPVSASGDVAASLTSPRLARRSLRRSQHSARSLTLNSSNPSQIDETVSKYWIMYENFRNRLKWNFPDTNLDCVNFGQISKGDNNLACILQYLHQNCPIRPRQWSAATCVIDYTLFILEQELKKASAESGINIQFSRFESTGSAASGTLTGAADRLDVLLVLKLSNCSEISILHSNFCEDIPAGHIIMGVKNREISQLNLKYLRKANVQGLINYYLIPKQVEEFVETLLKKTVSKFNRDHRSKFDRLPFKFQMSPNKKFVLTFDTRLVHGLGLGIGEINLRFIPAIMLNVPQCSLLPPLYAVPSWGQYTKSNQETSAPSSLFGRIFGDQDHSDLIWNLSTVKLQASIIQDLDERFNLSGVKSHHRECLMILKALFSQGNKNKLLNKGEIDPCVLETVINFLLLESSPLKWTFGTLADRVSDAIHFLKSAYQNNWLPNFVVHNPHLTKQVPSLEILSPLLSGRQQNMLADVTNDAASKVLDYIDQRLQETGLSRCIKPEFSPDMWEYEFFMFG